MGNWYNFFVRYRSLMIQHHDTLGVLIFANPLSHRDASHRVETMESSLTFQSLTLNGRLKGCGNTISLYIQVSCTVPSAGRFQQEMTSEEPFSEGKGWRISIQTWVHKTREVSLVTTYLRKNYLCYTPEVGHSPGKMVGWKITFLSGWLILGANC